MLNRKKYQEQWWKNNPEKVKEIKRRYKEKHPNSSKKANIKFKHNLSYEDWLKMWEDQNGKCIICEKSFAPSDACVDHNHKTNKIRGLLCHKCNWGIGFFNDNPKLMIRAADYLLKE